jgi:hypothetical protein
MYVPQVRERVQLAGRSGVFLVMWVDHEQREADLIPLGTVSSVEETVSFSELQAHSDNRLPAHGGYEPKGKLPHGSFL